MNLGTRAFMGHRGYNCRADRTVAHSAFCALMALALGMALPAAVKPGENILANGALEADQTDFPIGWHVSSDSKKFVKWMPSGGPGALPYFRLESTSSEPQGATIRQTGVNLASNGLYRLSAKVRTKNFQCKSAGVIVINHGWKQSRTVGTIPKDTDGQWIFTGKTILKLKAES